MWGTGLLKNVHATIPKGNMGYDGYTVPDTVAVEPTFIAFLYHSQTYVQGLSCHSFFFFLKNSEPKTIHNTFRVVACTLSDNLSRNSCIYLRLGVTKLSFLFIYFQYGPNTCSYCTIGWHRTYPICAKKLHFRDQRVAASLRYGNYAEITALTCEEKPYPVWFSCQSKIYRVSLDSAHVKYDV